VQDILEAALRLKKAGEPFVLATVVRAEKPTSAKPGAKALIKADGEWIGWIGGSCSKPAVAAEAKKVLASGQAKVLRSRLRKPARVEAPSTSISSRTCRSLTWSSWAIFPWPKRWSRSPGRSDFASRS
jgi:xanthine dehydrogenase accessory factor